MALQLRPGLPPYGEDETPAPALVVASATPVMPPSAAPARRSPPRTPLVIAGIVVLAILAGVLWVTLPHGEPPLHGHPNWPWWVFALQFGAAELFVMHVQIRREARTVSLSDIPLVAGLFMLTPGHLLIARLVGPMLVFALHRKQTALKLAFNAALLLAEASFAVGVFHALVGSSPTGPRSWLAAYVAVTAAGAFAAMAVTTVIGFAEGVLRGEDLLRAAWSGFGVAVMLTTLGLVAVNALVADPATAWLLLGCVITTFVMYRAYASLSDRHLSLERLYHFSQAVGRNPGVNEVLRSVLSEARELLRAERSEVAFLAERSAASGVRVTDGPAGLAWEKAPADPIPEWLRHRVIRRMVPTLLTRSTKNEQERAYLTRRGWRDAIIVPLRGESGAIGALVVADRMGNVRTFDSGDVRLLETVANHAAIALRNSTLIDQLTHEAMHDSLTGLPNRALLQRRLGEALTQAADHTKSVAVMIMDLDGFKDVNDTLGHHSGDDLLIEVARRMTAAAGPEMTVARLGGDEFAVLLPQVEDAATAILAGERLLVALEPPVTLAEIDVQIRASVGAAVTSGRVRTAMSELLKQADVAMYAAKVRGGGVRLYESAMSTSSPEQLALVAELRRAIAEDQLSVYVQPKVSIRSGRVSGVEALVRWEHPRHGLLAPAAFIPVAERAGLIQPLTTAVLRHAVAACAGWHRRGLAIDIAVNLSARSLDDPHLGDRLAALLGEHDLSPEHLTLEITEDSVMADAPRTVRVLDRLHNMGIRLSVDDFGTGYSSLAYLSRLPVDEVKIDRSFVANIDRDSHDQTIVRAIADLAGNLSLDVVAEGVEDAGAYARLAEFGCDLAQGYHIGRPMPLHEFLPWLSAYRPTRERSEALRR